MSNRTKIAEGKTKIIWASGNGEVVVQSKNDITAGDGARHDEMEQKAEWATTTTCNIFERLEAEGVPTHYIIRNDETSFVARRVEMIPVEIVMRRIAFGSFLKRNPEATEGERFNTVAVEFFHKDDANHDPMLVIHGHDGTVTRHDAGRPLDAADSYIDDLPDEMAAKVIIYCADFERIGRQVFKSLETAWAELGHTLVDLKIECGFDAETGELLLADVIDNDSWRVWLDGDPEQQVDKQVYRDHGLDEPETAQRIKGNYALVAKLTESFVPTEA